MKIILNDKTVSEATMLHKAEMDQLAKPATIEDAEAVLSNSSPDELTRFLPKGTIAGEIRRAKKGGVTQAYGFVSNGWGDVFVPPFLMSDYKDGEVVAVLVNEVPRGRAAMKIAPIKQFISWHRSEILDNIIKFIDEDRANKMSWSVGIDPSNGWEEMKAKCKTLGLQLVEIIKETETRNYGGHGRDYYRFSTPVTAEQAEEVLTILGGRHAEAEPKGSYDPGHDHIVVLINDNGFCNAWCGPWTD